MADPEKPRRKFLAGLFARLAPSNRRPDGQLFAPQIERALSWIWLAFLLGFIVVAVMALGRPTGARLHFFAIASLAALCALAIGGAMGLLFGLPTSAGRVPVNAQAAGAQANATAGGGQGNSTRRVEDGWYRDNTSLEQIAQWLTTAIVALSLANFDGWMNRFDRLAQSLTCAMYAPVTGNPANVFVGCSLSGGVPGGLLLAAYAILGFVAGYLWARRYLMGELTEGITESLSKANPEVAATENERLARSRAGNLVQEVPSSAVGKNEAQRAVDQLPSKGSDPFKNITAVQPGTVTNDPWKGQFGGRSADERAALSAVVTELTTQAGLYRIDIGLRGVDDQARMELRDKPVRIYLHPTFPEPIRTARFDTTGELRLPLVGFGAFTVGVQFEDNRKLELDLASLPNAPEPFKLA